jgi:hypothetical protein
LAVLQNHFDSSKTCSLYGYLREGGAIDPFLMMTSSLAVSTSDRVESIEKDPDATQTLQATSDKKYLWDGMEIAEERDITGGISPAPKTPPPACPTASGCRRRNRHQGLGPSCQSGQS